MSAQPCKECHRRPKAPGRHRCATCQLRNEPIGVQVAAAQRRLVMIPEPMRVKRTKTIEAQAPAGTSWCAGCQSFRDVADFGKGATQCRACISAKTHAAMIEKTYGLASSDYDALLKRQGGKCAICRARPKSKRLAVDHDHKTGAVRGLLCSRCNHDLMGSAWDSLALASALWHYMNTPPAGGAWLPPETAPQLAPIEAGGKALANASGGLPLVSGRGAAVLAGTVDDAATVAECAEPHYLPVGSERVPGKSGVWRYLVEDESDPPF